MARWLVLPFAFVSILGVACGGKRKVGTTTTPDDGAGSGSGTAVEVIKQTLVRFGTENAAPQAAVPHTRIWLVVTDETGAAKSYPMDEIDAPCAAEAGGEMGALGTLRCVQAGTGANYIAVGRGGEIILLRQAVAPGEDDNDYEELSRVAVTVGARLAFQQ